jgi:hypothetical protein
MSDPWTEGYRAALDGATYDNNPHHEPQATAWAFGCSEGMKERNRLALRALFRTELTPTGEQTVIPGCERDAAPSVRQLDLF